MLVASLCGGLKEVQRKPACAWVGMMRSSFVWTGASTAFYFFGNRSIRGGKLLRRHLPRAVSLAGTQIRQATNMITSSISTTSWMLLSTFFPRDPRLQKNVRQSGTVRQDWVVVGECVSVYLSFHHFFAPSSAEKSLDSRNSESVTIRLAIA